MAARLSGLRLRIPRGRGDGFLPLVAVVCNLVEVSASGSSHDQWNPTKCGVSEYYREASIIRRSWPTRDCSTMGKNIYSLLF